MAKFRAYSFLNVLLILKQCPNAKRVAGYKTWLSFGRQVKKGAKGIMILAPMHRQQSEKKEPSGEVEESRHATGFRAVYVWDEQQTAGNDLPQIGSVTGDPAVYLERLSSSREMELRSVTLTPRPGQRNSREGRSSITISGPGNVRDWC
jgi:antirestriction protein ArdC